MKRLCCTLMLLAGMTVIQACGGSSAMEQSLDPAAQGTTLQPPDGLPAIDELNALPDRDLSVTAPGWYQLDLLNRSYGNFETGVTVDDPALDIEGAGGNGFCVFGIAGFEGDSYPTGLRADVSELSGEYFLMYTNYVTGRWETAGPFTDSATYEYPEVSEYSAPDILASGYMNHFVGILVPDGGNLQLDMLQLGVDGGNEGPEFVGNVEDRSNEDRVTIAWSHSSSFDDPDFAGYSVERSPFPPGTYTKLTDENIFDNFFIDEEVPLNSTHLYRVTAWDTSGNASLNYGFPASRIAGDTSKPVCVVDMPRGPLTGPVKVKIDLSQSFDNDGDAFTEYTVDWGFGLGEVTQPGPIFEETLQPGCYSIRCKAVAGGADDSKRHELKVYPQWQEESTLIDAGTPAIYRHFAPRSFYDEDSGKAVFIFSDAAVPSIVSLTVDSSGNTDRFDLVHVYEDAQVLCSEPQYRNGSWTFLVGTESGLISCSWQDNELTPYFAGVNTDTANSALVSDGGNGFWALHQEINVGYDIGITDLNTFQEVLLVPGLLNGNFFDACWNPAAEAIDLVYSGSGFTEWLRWSPVIGPIDSFTINAADSQFIDIELDPATGRPAVLIADGTSVLYSELNADNMTWTVANKVDGIDPDWPQTALIYRDGTAYCFVGDNPGGSTLYRKNGANWDVINDSDYADGGLYNTMAYIPSEPGFIVLDVALDWATRVTLMQEDGSETELLKYDGWARNALELSAAASDTDIHLLHKPFDNYLHWTSADGVSWTETTDAGLGTGGKIAADANGDIYASLVNGGNAYLRRWADPAWIDEQINPISNNSLPVIYGQGYGLAFGNFNADAVPDTFYFKRDLNPSFDISTEATEVWDGAMAGASANEAKFLLRYNGFNFNSGDIGIMNTSGEFEYLFEPSFEFFDDPWTLGRHMEGAFFRNIGNSSREVFYVAYGPDGGLARIYRDLYGEWQYDTFPVVFPELDPTNHRRTVSATTAWGDSSVGIGSSIEGHVFFFEWDNFGDFEELPLPGGMENADFHELVVGPDGRWHIIYRDYINDDLRILSTV